MRELAKEYGTADRQEELLIMIKDIDMLFKENKIQYSLCGGSLLGAIREKGFIPWDDDIDIMCDRNNYKRIIKLFSQNRGNLSYVLRRHLWIDRIQKKNEKKNDLTVPTIDIFIMDRCPDNIIMRKIKVLTIRCLQGMIKEKPQGDEHKGIMKLLLWITYFIGRPFSYNRKFNWYMKVSQWGSNENTKYITGYNDFFNLVTLRYTGKLMDSFEYHVFEDTELPITKEYDNYLSTQYGDYMTPPPKKERVPIHNY